MAEKAGEKHRASWEALGKAASEGGYAKYALYASRSLAVSHPEIYLMGDRWFYDLASRCKGFKAFYRDPTSLGWLHMKYGSEFRSAPPDFEGLSDGEVLDFAGIDLHEYRPTSPDRILPGPYEPFVDHRLGPLAVTLKTEGRVVTELELAEIAYFQAIARGVKETELFLVACVDGSGYLLEGDRLVSMVSDEAVDAPAGSPYLIFNTESVWYPLMERDDSATSPALERAVNRLATPAGTPGLNPWEAALVGTLRTATELSSDEQRDLAAIAATRTTAWRCHPAYRAWLQFVPDSDFDGISGHLCVVREFDRLANSVSPGAAYLYGFLMGDGTVEERVRRFCHEYLIRLGVVREAEKKWKPAWRLEAWGHVWPCALMEHTIDDGFRARTGHCVSQAHMTGAVLEMAGIPHVVVNFARGGVTTGVSHHFVMSQDGTFVIDDGIPRFRNEEPSTSGKGPRARKGWGPMLSFAVGGEWGRTIASDTYSNASPERLVELLQTCEGAVGGRFDIQFYSDKSHTENLSMEEYVEIVARSEVHGVNLP